MGASRSIKLLKPLLNAEETTKVQAITFKHNHVHMHGITDCREVCQGDISNYENVNPQSVFSH